MKIYWTRKSIPELTPLPPTVRKQNYKDAFYMAGTHVEFWLAAAVYLLLLWSLLHVFNMLFPGDNSSLRNILKCVFAVLPASMVWNQLVIYVMRKYCKHILVRNA